MNKITETLADLFEGLHLHLTGEALTVAKKLPHRVTIAEISKFGDWFKVPKKIKINTEDIKKDFYVDDEISCVLRAKNNDGTLVVVSYTYHTSGQSLIFDQPTTVDIIQETEMKDMTTCGTPRSNICK